MSERPENLPEATLPRQKTDDELKKLAMDIFNGHVFCDWMVEEAQTRLLGMVFMPLALMEQEHIQKLFEEEEASMLYEYLEKAGPRSVNGLPGFFSMRVLNRADHDALVPLIQAYAEKQKEFLEGDQSTAAATEGADPGGSVVRGEHAGADDASTGVASEQENRGSDHAKEGDPPRADEDGKEEER